MKIQNKDIEFFLKSPPENIKAVLIYGPDQGLVKERAKLLTKQILPEVDDFSVQQIPGTSIEEDEARLMDAATSFSLMGGKQVIRVLQAEDKITQSCKSLLENGNFEHFVIVESDNLTPKSALRKLFESADNAAAVPCYAEEGRNLGNTIASILSEAGKKADRDAMLFLSQNLQGDRMIIRSELEKLITYLGEKTTVSIEDVETCIGTKSSTSFGAICFATASGNLKIMDEKLSQAFDEGFPPPSLLRAMQNHVKRLHKAKSLVEQGSSTRDAMSKLSPPVFFKETAAFEGQMNKWSMRALESMLSMLMEAETQCKTTGLPAETICAQALTKIAARARR